MANQSVGVQPKQRILDMLGYKRLTRRTGKILRREAMEKIYDVVVIGGGPGGLYGRHVRRQSRAGYPGAGEADCRRADDRKTLQIDNYPGFEEGIDGITLGRKDAGRSGALRG